MSNLAETKFSVPSIPMNEAELLQVLQSSLYPGAALSSIKMVIEYCKASGLDPMQKPVHIVPMWDRNTNSMRDVIMPGVGLYRTQAARTGQFAGMTEPEYGPMITEQLSGQSITFPEWAKVTVKRLLPNGTLAEFTSTEYWMENYAVKGGKEKSIAPNAMWTKRPRGQIAKCASAQALRIAFPELGAQATAEEMEGKTYDIDSGSARQSGTAAAELARPAVVSSPERDKLIADLEIVATEQGIDAYANLWAAMTPANRKMVGGDEHTRIKAMAGKKAAETVEFTEAPHVTE